MTNGAAGLRHRGLEDFTDVAVASRRRIQRPSVGVTVDVPSKHTASSKQMFDSQEEHRSASLLAGQYAWLSRVSGLG
jgi:hypothetical protein